MAERWSDSEARVTPSRSLEERLRDHPEWRAKVESLLAGVENAAGDVEKAAVALDVLDRSLGAGDPELCTEEIRYGLGFGFAGDEVGAGAA